MKQKWTEIHMKERKTAIKHTLFKGSNPEVPSQKLDRCKSKAAYISKICDKNDNKSFVGF